MAKTKVIVGQTKVEKAPAKFAEKSLKEKLLIVLETVKGLEVQNAQGKNNKAWKEFIEMVAQAVETGNFDITEEGKITINLVTPENRAQAEELVKALNCENIKDVNDLNNPELILAEVNSLLTYIASLEAANDSYEKDNDELTKKLEQTQQQVKDIEESFKNLENEVALAEQILVRATGMDIKDVQEKVKEHNEKNPDNQISTIVYLAQKVEEIKAKETSNTKSGKKGSLVKNILIGGLAFSTLLGFAGAAHHAAQQKDLENELNAQNQIVLNIENLDPELRAYIESLMKDNDLTMEEVIDFIKDQQNVIDTQKDTIGKQEDTIEELNGYKDKFENIKDGLTGAGYSYITDDNIDLEGLINDLGDGEYSVETQQAYDTFIGYLESQGIKYEDLLDENGNYDPDLCPANIEAYVTNTIKYLDSIQTLDGKLDDAFNKLEVVDENGNAVTISTFESRQEAYEFIINYIEEVKAKALNVLNGLDQNATAEDYKNAMEVIEQIESEVDSLLEQADKDNEAYQALAQAYEELKAENEALQKENENLKQNGNSQGGVEEEEQEQDNNQTVSGGQGSQDSATGDSGKNPTGGKKPADQENEYGD